MGNRITMRFATNHRAFDYDWEGLPIKDKMNANIWLTRYHNHLKNGDALDEYRRKELIERYKKMFEGDSKRRECCMDVRYVDMSGSNIQYSIVHAEVEFPAQHAGEALSALGLSGVEIEELAETHHIQAEGFLDGIRKIKLSPDDFTAADFPFATGTKGTLEKFAVLVLDNAKGFLDARETSFGLYHVINQKATSSKPA
ncbi:MAG TPA: hypothetical protein VJH90_00540 [archaeon]|nr:hypothetical protein [archaeon]